MRNSTPVLHPMWRYLVNGTLVNTKPLMLILWIPSRLKKCGGLPDEEPKNSKAVGIKSRCLNEYAEDWNLCGRSGYIDRLLSFAGAHDGTTERDEVQYADNCCSVFHKLGLLCFIRLTDYTSWQVGSMHVFAHKRSTLLAAFKSAGRHCLQVFRKEVLSHHVGAATLKKRVIMAQARLFNFRNRNLVMFYKIFLPKN